MAAREAADARSRETPYDYVAAVNRYLQDGFTLRRGPGPGAARAARRSTGSCSTRRAATASTSPARWRCCCGWAAIPARVVTGFSPGGYSKRKHAWIVRDTDAHSWVEAWFDELRLGDVRPDARRRRRPARRSRRSSAPDEPTTPSGGDAASATRAARRRARAACAPDLLGGADGQAGGASGAAAAGGGGRRRGAGSSLAGLALAALVAWFVLRAPARGASGPAAALDRAVAELEAALRRRRAAGGGGHDAARSSSSGSAARPRRSAYLRALRARPLRAARRAADARAGGGRCGASWAARAACGGGCARCWRCRPGGLEARRARSAAGEPSTAGIEGGSGASAAPPARRTRCVASRLAALR